MPAPYDFCSHRCCSVLGILGFVVYTVISFDIAPHSPRTNFYSSISPQGQEVANKYPTAHLRKVLDEIIPTPPALALHLLVYSRDIEFSNLYLRGGFVKRCCGGVPGMLCTWCMHTAVAAVAHLSSDAEKSSARCVPTAAPLLWRRQAIFQPFTPPPQMN